jgi:hypothetical protein
MIIIEANQVEEFTGNLKSNGKTVKYKAIQPVEVKSPAGKYA